MLYDDMSCFETALILRQHRQPAQSIERPRRPADLRKPDRTNRTNRTAVQRSGRSCYISAEIRANQPMWPVTPIASFAGRFRTNWLYPHLLLLLTDIWQSVHDGAATLQLSTNISVL